MTALAGPRVTGSIRYISRDFRPMAAAAKIWPGALVVAFTAGGPSGYYAQGQAGAVVAVGKATGLGGPQAQGGMGAPAGTSLTGGVVDNTAGANGALFVEVEYLNPFWIMLLDNDGTAPVVVADRESLCYVLDDHTVSHSNSGNGTAGKVYDVTSEGVWVKVGT
jgi:hypothetical protein